MFAYLLRISGTVLKTESHCNVGYVLTVISAIKISL